MTVYESYIMHLGQCHHFFFLLDLHWRRHGRNTEKESHIDEKYSRWHVSSVIRVAADGHWKVNTNRMWCLNLRVSYQLRGTEDEEEYKFTECRHKVSGAIYCFTEIVCIIMLLHCIWHLCVVFCICNPTHKNDIKKKNHPFKSIQESSGVRLRG